MTSFRLRIVLAISIICSTTALVCIDGTKMNAVYAGLRMLGFMAYPIASFLLVEGFYNTRSKKKYFINLFAAGLLAELPYLLVNLRLLNKVNDTLHAVVGQNAVFNSDGMKALSEKISERDFVYYYDMFRTAAYYAINPMITLACALLMLIALDKCREKFVVSKKLLFVLSTTGIMIGFILVTVFFPFDSAVEILLFTALFYYIRGNKPAIAVMTTMMIFSFYMKVDIVYAMGVMLGVILIFLYNAQSGTKKYKYAFYAVYPAHLVLFYIIGQILG